MIKNWKSACKEIYQDCDGWWATLKPGYVWGVDETHVFNGETWKQLCDAAREIRKEPDEK